MEIKYKNTKYNIHNKMLKSSLGALLLLSAFSECSHAMMWEGDNWKVEVRMSPQRQEPNDSKQQRKQQRKIEERNRPRALVVHPVSRRVEQRHITMAEYNQLQGQGTKIKFYGRTRSNGELKRIDYEHYLERLGHKKHRPVIAEICGQ